MAGQEFRGWISDARWRDPGPGAGTLGLVPVPVAIEHAALRPEATVAEVLEGAAIAASRGCVAVCVAPAMVHPVVTAMTRPDGGAIAVASVVGFPHGTQLSRTKAVEAAAAVAHGAERLVVVADLGAVADGDLAAVAADVASVRDAVPSTLIDVVVESALWTPAVLRQVCEAVIDGGADSVTTSSGFHPAGGASDGAVAVLRAAAGDRARVTAAGGITDSATALAMVEAGADTLRLADTFAVLDGLR